MFFLLASWTATICLVNLSLDLCVSKSACISVDVAHSFMGNGNKPKQCVAQL